MEYVDTVGIKGKKYVKHVCCTIAQRLSADRITGCRAAEDQAVQEQLDDVEVGRQFVCEMNLRRQFRIDTSIELTIF